MHITHSDQSSEPLFRLEIVLGKISRFLARHGIHKHGNVSQANRRRLLTWPKEKLDGLISRTERILQVHLEAEAEPDFDIDDSTRLLRIALKAIGLNIDPSFYNMIKRSDILEVYDKEHIQIFRSFNFFRICNYNLEDILSHEWYELYDRAESVTNEIMNIVTEHMASSRTITKVVMEPHLMRERFSEPRGTFITHFKYYANIYSGPEQKEGCVVTISAKPLPAEHDNLDFLRSKSGKSRPIQSSKA